MATPPAVSTINPIELLVKLLTSYVASTVPVVLGTDNTESYCNINGVFESAKPLTSLEPAEFLNVVEEAEPKQIRSSVEDAPAVAFLIAFLVNKQQ